MSCDSSDGTLSDSSAPNNSSSNSNLSSDTSACNDSADTSEGARSSEKHDESDCECNDCVHARERKQQRAANYDLAEFRIARPVLPVTSSESSAIDNLTSSGSSMTAYSPVFSPDTSDRYNGDGINVDRWAENVIQ